MELFEPTWPLGYSHGDRTRIRNRYIVISVIGEWCFINHRHGPTPSMLACPHTFDVNQDVYGYNMNINCESSCASTETIVLPEHSPKPDEYSCHTSQIPLSGKPGRNCKQTSQLQDYTVY